MTSGRRRSPIRHGRRSRVRLLVALLVAVGMSPAVPVAGMDRPVAPAAVQDGVDASGSVAAPVLQATKAAKPPSADVPDAGADAAGLQPSIQYEEAVAHERDRIAFTPGARVTVAYAPRASDRWSVGGGTPVALPVGRLDGRAIRHQGATSESSPGRVLPDRTVDLPNPPNRVIQATPASFTPEPATGTVSTEAAVSSAGLRREIFGFLPYWQVNAGSLRLDYRRISTIAYFGIAADGGGNLAKRNADGSTSVGWSGWTSAKMTSIISAAHRARTRVVLTVQSFGWNTTGLARQKRLLGSPTARANLARQIAAAVRDRGADGVNLDFEPLARGYETEFTALVRGIRSQLNHVHRGYQLTFDTTGRIGNYPIEAATARGGADAIFVMGYDYRTGSSSPVGSIAPVTRSGYDVQDTIAAYTSRVAASKVILGVPWYGRAWSTSTDARNASNTSSARTGASTSVTYDTAADYLAQYGRRYDPVEGVAWTAYRRKSCTATYGCVTSWRQLYVDDATALGRKYDLVNQYGLRGAGIWALGYDGTRPELWNAIQTKFITDTTAPTVGVVTMPVRTINPAVLVKWVGVDNVGITAYDTQVSVDGGRWIAWLTSTRATSGVYPAVDGHGYAFRVRARDAKGNRSAWNVTSTARPAGASLAVGGFGVVRASGLAVRAAPGSSAKKVGTVGTGRVLAIVGGPRRAGSSTWYQVVGPLTEWTAVRSAIRGWVAVRTGGTTLVSPTKAPNATRVDAYLGHLGFGGAGAASIGSGVPATKRAFSPNGDRSKDAIRIDWTNAVRLDRLVLRVFRANGTLVGDVPVNQLAVGKRATTWNGTVGGRRLTDGRYLVSLVGRKGAATYYNPVITFSAARLLGFGLTIDTVAPVVRTATVSGSLLSPNGDGSRDSIRVSIAASGASGWAFGVAPVRGSAVGAPILIRSGSGGAAAVAWDGRTSRGTIAADGAYRLQMVAFDPAGNRTSRSWTVRLDRSGPTIAVTAPGTFSPNGDGAADTARLAWSSPEPITGTIRVLRGSTVVRSWSIAQAASGAVTWRGTTAAGKRVADGAYTVRISGRDAAGNATTRAVTIRVDRTLATLRWSPASIFSQDGDAIAATSRLTFSTSRPATVSASIYSGSTLVRRIWTNRRLGAGRHAWTWDGRNGAGILVPRGTYTVRVAATSTAGTSVLARNVLVDAFAVGTSSSAVAPGQTLTITLATTEPLKAAPTVAFGQPGRSAVRKVATSLGGGRYRVAFVIARGRAGTATIAITGRDVRGGSNTTSRTVAVR